MSVAIARSGWRCTPPAAPSEAAARVGKAGALDVQRGGSSGDMDIHLTRCKWLFASRSDLLHTVLS